MRALLCRPPGVGRVQDQYVGPREVVGRGPAVGRRDGDALGPAQKRRPALLPERVVMLVDSVVLRPGDEHDLQRANVLIAGRPRGFQDGVDLGASSRRRGTFAADRGGAELGSEQEGQQVLQLRRAKHLHQSLGHRRDGYRLHRLDVGLGEDRLTSLAVANAQCRPRGADRAGEDAAVDQRHAVGDVVGVEREARLADVAEDRCVVAVHQVRQVGADRASPAPNRMTLGAACLLAEEQVAARRPAPAGQLGRQDAGSASLTRRRAGAVPTEGGVLQSGKARGRSSSFVW